jgi:hypothetical protein
MLVNSIFFPYNSIAFVVGVRETRLTARGESIELNNKRTNL